MSMNEAKQAAAKAVISAAERDTGSGNGLVICEITDGDVSITEYDEFPDPEEV